MFRVALTAYLSFTAALGPLLCCCSLGQLVPITHSSNCCRKAESLAAKTISHHHHGHSHHSHDHHDNNGVANTGSTSASKPELPVDHSNNPLPRDPCPCQHQSQMAALTSFQNSGLQISMDGLSSIEYLAISYSLRLSHALSFKLEISFLSNGPPASLFGREMLRAYHILRC